MFGDLILRRYGQKSNLFNTGGGLFLRKDSELLPTIDKKEKKKRLAKLGFLEGSSSVIGGQGNAAVPPSGQGSNPPSPSGSFSPPQQKKQPPGSGGQGAPPPPTPSRVLGQQASGQPPSQQASGQGVPPAPSPGRVLGLPSPSGAGTGLAKAKRPPRLTNIPKNLQGDDEDEYKTPKQPTSAQSQRARMTSGVKAPKRRKTKQRTSQSPATLQIGSSPAPAPASQGGDRGNLLSDIRKGKKLRKVSQRKQQAPAQAPNQGQPQDMMTALRQKLTSRRMSMEPPEAKQENKNEEVNESEFDDGEENKGNDQPIQGLSAEMSDLVRTVREKFGTDDISRNKARYYFVLDKMTFEAGNPIVERSYTKLKERMLEDHGITLPTKALASRSGDVIGNEDIKIMVVPQSKKGTNIGAKIVSLIEGRFAPLQPGSQ